MTKPTLEPHEPEAPIQGRGESDPARATSLALRLRAALLGLLDAHHRAGATSADPYEPSPTYHAMADGKFLSALAVARTLDLVDEKAYRAMLEAAEARLAEHSVEPPRSETAAWGLRFGFGGCGPEEPYLITSAVVVHGLLDHHGELRTDLEERAIRWLARYPWRDSISVDGETITLPRFSPNTPKLVVNAVAYWAAALHRSGRELPDAIARSLHGSGAWLESRFHQAGGWTYTDESPRVDLLHQCYILASALRLLPRAACERMALSILPRFHTASGWIDKIDLVDEAQALDAAARSGGVSISSAGSTWIVAHHDPARPWSLGELAVVLSQLAAEGPRASYWRALLKRLGATIADAVERADPLGAPPESLHLRHLAHLAHGIACILESFAEERRALDAKRTAIREATNAVARAYDRGVEAYLARLERPIERFITRVESKWLRKFVPRGSRVLVVGCGAAREIGTLVDLGCKLTCLDGSEAMLERAREHWRDRSIEWRLGDAHEIEGPEDSFDCIVCLETLGELADAPLALQEIRRALRRGGRLLLSSANKRHPRASSVGEDVPLRHFHVDELIQLVVRAGLALVEVRGLRRFVDRAPAGWNRPGLHMGRPLLGGVFLLERALGRFMDLADARTFWVIARK